MSMQKKRALLECGCGCGCVGACFPVNRNVTPNVLVDIPWTISAPNCPAIDGLTGVFQPFNASWVESNCGPCTCYESTVNLSLPAKRKLSVGGDDGDPETLDPPPFCSEASVPIVLKFWLTTDNTIEGCCKVAILVELVSYGDGNDLSCGNLVNDNDLNCLPFVSPADPKIYRKFALDLCTCLGVDEGFMGEFDLSRICWSCSLGTHLGDACPDGSSLCPELDGCSLVGATLSM